MFDLWMDYICVCIIKLMLKLKHSTEIIPTLHRRTGILALLRTLILVLCASAFPCGGLWLEVGEEAVK